MSRFSGSSRRVAGPKPTPTTTQGDIIYRDTAKDARLAAGTSGFYLKTQGSGANPIWADVVFRSYLAGLTLSNAGGDPTNDITVAVGQAVDSTNARVLTLGSTITKQLDVNWSVGNNAGGLDTGGIANGTYHVWLIMRSDTGVVDVLFSTSASAPTMPTNYDFKRRIGSILRESATIIAFSQSGDEFLRNAAILDVTANNPGTSAVSRTL